MLNAYIETTYRVSKIYIYIGVCEKSAAKNSVCARCTFSTSGKIVSLANFHAFQFEFSCRLGYVRVFFPFLFRLPRVDFFLFCIPILFF